MPIDAERVQSVFLAAIASTTAQECAATVNEACAGDAQLPPRRGAPACTR